MVNQTAAGLIAALTWTFKVSYQLVCSVLSLLKWFCNFNDVSKLVLFIVKFMLSIFFFWWKNPLNWTVFGISFSMFDARGFLFPLSLRWSVCWIHHSFICFRFVRQYLQKFQLVAVGATSSPVDTLRTHYQGDQSRHPNHQRQTYSRSLVIAVAVSVVVVNNDDGDEDFDLCIWNARKSRNNSR